MAKFRRWVDKFGRLVAKLVARLLATAAVLVRIQTSLKNKKIGRHKQRGGQRTVARQKSIQKKDNRSPRFFTFFISKIKIC